MSSVGERNWLGFDEGGFRGFAENGRRDLAAGIAADASRVHKEIARGVFRPSLFRICHDRASHNHSTLAGKSEESDLFRVEYRPERSGSVICHLTAVGIPTSRRMRLAAGTMNPGPH